MLLLSSSEITAVFHSFLERLPQPQTELNYHNSFTLLVAVVLSAQMTDKGVNRATAPLFSHVSHPSHILAMGEEALLAALSSINLYKTKAKNVMTLCQQLIDFHGGEVPQTREALEALAGVGRKTANVVLNVAFGQKTMAVDTHIFRLSRRLGISAGKNVREVEEDLLKKIPDEFMEHAHHWLILHGRYVCKARNPSCETCFLREICPQNEV